MQNVCPNGLHPLVHLARDVLCIMLICFVYLILIFPLNILQSYWDGNTASLVLLVSTFGEKIFLAQGHNIVTQVRSDTRPLAPESDALTNCPAPHPTPLSSSISFISIIPLQLESENMPIKCVIILFSNTSIASVNAQMLYFYKPRKGDD